jgi:hypothetical protein
MERSKEGKEGKMSKDDIKPSVLVAITRWVENGTPTGGFVRACLENNLLEAVIAADDENLKALPQIVLYLYGNVPGPCWGSPEKCVVWAYKKARLREVKSDG